MVVHARYPVGEPRVEREARAARHAGFAVCVICLRHPGEPRAEEIDGIEIRRLPVEHVRGASFLSTLREYAGFAALATVAVGRMALRREIDLLHVHAPPDFLIACGMIPKALRKPLILDIHDLSPHMLSARMAGRRGAKVLRALLTGVEWLACALSDRVITVHEPYRREIVSHRVPAAKTAVVMNSADEAVIGRVRSTAEGPRHDPATFTVAYHGTINEWYGVDILVEAIARVRDRVPNVRALILGEGDALGGVRALADRLGVSDRVEFSARYLPLEETLRRIEAADCGVIPNRPTELNRFALSSKLFEYVSLGIPVAVARLETLAAHFDDSEVTFFEPGSATSLADAFEWCAAHTEAALEKAERARERASAYAWSQNAERYVAILRELAPWVDGGDGDLSASAPPGRPQAPPAPAERERPSLRSAPERRGSLRPQRR